MNITILLPESRSLGLNRSAWRLFKWLGRLGATVQMCGMQSANLKSDIILALNASKTGMEALSRASAQAIPYVLRSDFFTMYQPPKAYSSASAFIAVSRQVAARAQMFGELHKINVRGITHIIPNGFDPEAYDHDVTIRVPELTHPIIATCGNIRGEKDPDTLLKAFELVKMRYPAASLLVIGTLDRTPPPGCHVTGMVQEYLTLGFMSGADVYVNSSRLEGMSNALLEAIYAGLPCAVTEASSDLVSGYVPSGDPYQLAEAINICIFEKTIGICADRGLRHKSMPNLQNPETEARKYLDLFKEILNGKQ